MRERISEARDTKRRGTTPVKEREMFVYGERWSRKMNQGCQWGQVGDDRKPSSHCRFLLRDVDSKKLPRNNIFMSDRAETAIFCRGLHIVKQRYSRPPTLSQQTPSVSLSRSLCFCFLQKYLEHLHLSLFSFSLWVDDKAEISKKKIVFSSIFGKTNRSVT